MSPSQTAVAGEALAVIVGAGLTVMVICAVSEHEPVEPVTV